jgi:hypothetical protein
MGHIQSPKAGAKVARSSSLRRRNDQNCQRFVLSVMRSRSRLVHSPPRKRGRKYDCFQSSLRDSGNSPLNPTLKLCTILVTSLREGDAILPMFCNARHLNRCLLKVRATSERTDQEFQKSSGLRASESIAFRELKRSRKPI